MEVKNKNISSNNEHNARALVNYFKNNFVSKKNPNLSSEEDGLSFWKKYFKSDQSKRKEDFSFIKQCYPQLNFPIEKGISETTNYKEATLKGKPISIRKNENQLALEDAGNISLELYNSFAGEVPVLTIPNENDFAKIIQSLLHKNKPSSVSSSMGASIINGINNWQKIESLKNNFFLQNKGNSWAQEFKENILPFPHLYKDKLILLSKKYYSNVPPNALELTSDYWSKISLQIRLNHECTHFYTIKKYGIASNNLHDELIADYIGMLKTIGFYNEQWMLHFMGLENYPNYRKDARLENYVQDIDINSSNFTTLTLVIKNAIHNLVDFDSKIGPLASNEDVKRRIQALCETDLLEIASEKGVEFLLEKYCYGRT